MLAKRIINSLGITPVIKIIYWLYLEMDARTMSEMPHVKHQARLKADKYNPF